MFNPDQLKKWFSEELSEPSEIDLTFSPSKMGLRQDLEQLKAVADLIN